MSFAFSFNPDSDDESSPSIDVSPPHPTKTLDSLSILPSNLPQLHTLDSLLQRLENVRLSFDTYTTLEGQIIYRRQLFDVKHQIMCEDDQESNSVSILLEDIEDVKTNVYEGGFKSWECSYDVINKLARTDVSKYNSCLDLGCGTSLPTCFLFMKHLESIKNGAPVTPMKYILSDFNYEVLRLVSLPNLIIHWASTLSVEKLSSLTSPDVNLANNELLLSAELISEFKSSLSQNQIELKFVSGAWGNEFNALVASENINFVITSETIYSQEISPVIAETLLYFSRGVERFYAMVAAKNIYFGVGGSVHGFLSYFSSINDGIQVEVEEIGSSQLKRSIIELTR